MVFKRHFPPFGRLWFSEQHFVEQYEISCSGG